MRLAQSRPAAHASVCSRQEWNVTTCRRILEAHDRHDASISALVCDGSLQLFCTKAHVQRKHLHLTRQLAEDTGAKRPAAPTTCHNALLSSYSAVRPSPRYSVIGCAHRATSFSASLWLLNSTRLVLGGVLSTGMAQS